MAAASDDDEEEEEEEDNADSDCVSKKNQCFTLRLVSGVIFFLFVLSRKEKTERYEFFFKRRGRSDIMNLLPSSQSRFKVA